MCGIAGYIYFNQEHPAVLSLLKKMTNIISYRGPDGEGFYIKKNIALGHRRLSIIDLNTGDQPMFNEDKTIALIFNGEIYNYIELREELISLGHNFYTTSDTEVVIKSFEQWGIDCQLKFNGCWAFALWDDRKKQLFLSRDRMGEKPLYYTIFDNTLLFASEIKSLFAYGVPERPNLDFTELYFGLINIPAPYTFYDGIYQIKPANYLLIKGSSLNEQAYWKLPDIDENNMLKDKKKIYETFTYLLTDAVRIRMRSDVPFGAFLSGGLDSSSIVALMAQSTNHPVKTFTIGFENSHYDESELALLTANKFNTHHFKGTVSPEDFGKALKHILFHYDGPFGDSSAIPTGQVSKFAREQVKMVLTGDGGDEVLSGYVSYQGIRLSQYYNTLPLLIQNLVPCMLTVFAKSLTGNIRFKVDKIKNASITAKYDFNRRMLEKFPTTSLDTIKQIIPESSKKITLEDYFNQIMKECPYKDDFYKLMYFNLKHSLPDDMLTKVDRMSMAHSLEARIPFLDHRLVEFMVTIDKDVKMQGLERKSVLRRTIGKQLPSALLRASKRGFGIPLLDWFKMPEFNERIELLKKTDVGLNNKTIGKIISENASGVKDNGNFIWMLFLYAEWLKK